MAKFNVEEYLDSLPDDIETIDIMCKNLKYLPDLSRFKKLETLSCPYNKLTSLPILPENLKELYCHYNNLTLLPVLPVNLKWLCCSNNKLTSLSILPVNLKWLNCSNNKLTSLPILPKNLKELHCHYNNLTSLPNLPKNLELLYCHYNNLISLPVLPEKLKDLSFFVNPISEIIVYYNYDYNDLNKNIKIWNNFRYLYYCLKYKKRFFKMMEPVIKKRYHPSYLYDLKEDDDLDKKLGEW